MNASRELKELLEKLPSKKPTELNHYVSITRYLLIGHFHHSIDQQLVQQDRADSLSCVKEILNCIDLTYAEFVSQQLKEKERARNHIDGQLELVKLRKQGKREKDRQIEEAKKKEQEAIVATAAAAAAANKPPMGLIASRASETVIEILDDTPPSSPTRREDEDDQKSDNKNDENPIRRGSNGLPLPPAPNEKLPPLPTGAFTTSPRSKPQPPPTAPPPPKPLPPPKPQPRAALPVNERTFNPPKAIAIQPDQPPHGMQNQPTYSSSLRGRPACTIHINQGFDNLPKYSTCTLDGPDVDSFYRRLERWEPYWNLVHDCTLKKHVGGADYRNGSVPKQYEIGCKTTRIARCAGIGPGNMMKTIPEPPIGATQLKFNIPLEVLQEAEALDWGKIRPYPPGKLSYKHGERRLLLRALPLHIPKKYVGKKSDTHLWPKGSFVQLNATPLVIAQRKQQSHDHVLWKGMCHALDLTQYVAHPTMINELCMVTRDDAEYAIQVAVLEYIAPDSLHELCLSPSTSSLSPSSYNKLSIQKLTKDEGMAVAMEYLKKDAVVVDDDDDDNGKDTTTTSTTPADITLTFSLLCSMSMTAMTTPVRGKQCRHMQCFDLRNYLHTNATVSGGRWRCGVCEDFVPVEDLVVDGMMVSMLEEIGKNKISGSRDKIQMSKNGSWKFMEENRLRYGGKKRPAVGGEDEDDSQKKTKPTNGVARQESEIIELI